MPTVKLVLIGASGVGKTSLRSQYITKRFSTAYRATIGADFITKTLPHPKGDPEGITLQIWDTAGQERFSGLSSAFFRGADAVVLMYDATSPETLFSLKKWWDDFKQHAPLADEDIANFCVAFVGNKIDKIDSTRNGSASNPTNPEVEVVTETMAQELISSLIPGTVPASPIQRTNGQASVSSIEPERSDSLSIDIASPVSSTIVAPHESSPKNVNFRKSTSSTTSARMPYTSSSASSTQQSIYHTPASSMFDVFHSARSSPTQSLSPSRSRSRLSSLSSSSSSRSSSALTITQSLFRRSSVDTTTINAGASVAEDADYLSGRPAHYRASAKSGAGVEDVFDYIARRVVYCLEQADARQGRQSLDRDEYIRVGTNDSVTDGWFKRTGRACCSS